MKRFAAALLASIALALQPAHAASILTTRADSAKPAQGTSGMGVYLFNGVPGLGAFDGTPAPAGAVPIAPIEAPWALPRSGGAMTGAIVLPAPAATANDNTATTTAAVKSVLPTATPRANGSRCDKTSHPLSEVFSTLAAAQVEYPSATALTEETDQVAIEKTIAQAVGFYQGRVMVQGWCKMSGPLAISISQFQGLHISGADQTSRLEWPAGLDGIQVTLQPIAAANSSTEWTPRVAFDHLTLLTDNVGAPANTALSIIQAAATAGQTSNTLSPQGHIDHVAFSAANGGAPQGAKGAWAIGAALFGLSKTEFLTNYFVGGNNDGNPGSDTTSIMEVIDTNGAIAANQSTTHLNQNSYLDYGGTALKIGNLNNDQPLQGVDVDHLTVNHAQYGVLWQMQKDDGAADLLFVKNSNIDAAIDAVYTQNVNGVQIMGSQFSNVRIISSRRIQIANNNMLTFGLSGTVVITDCPNYIDGGTSITDNLFPNYGGPPILLTGTTSGVWVNGDFMVNSSFGLIADETTGKNGAIKGVNYENGQTTFGGGVSCAGAPSSSYTVSNGIVTHC